MQQINGSWQDEAAADDEETLSLCDLVTSSDATEYWNGDNGFSKEDDNGDNLFEFFSSEDFPASAAAATPRGYPDKNIVFCGKLIQFKDQQQQQPNSENKLPQSLKTSKVKGDNHDDDDTRSSCIFPWKMSQYSFNKSRTFPSSSKGSAQRKSLNKSLSLPVEESKGKYYGSVGGGDDRSKKLGDDDKFDFSVKKVSVLATPVKSRWYLFAFGVGRFPMDMELKDMKLRQDRKRKAMKFQAPEATDAGGKERRRSGKGMWRLLKVLGLKSKDRNGDVVEAAFGCKSHV
ncbi:hypothetical protein PTKIN_Ptkin16aG0474200 [Pterospermum kingtungense]